MSLIVNLKPKKRGRLRKKKKVQLADKKAKPIKTNVKWKAFEFEEYKKNKSWIFKSGLIALILLVLAIFSKNFLLVILVCLGYFSFVAYAFKKPRKINFAVTPKGVVANQALFNYDNLSSFWIFYNPPQQKELSLRSKKKLMPYIKIPLAGQNPVAIRRALMEYLPEKKHKESTIDELARSIKF